MKLSIIVPVYNEKETIGKVLSKIISLKLPVLFEIIVVDDGSIDGTTNILKNWSGGKIRIIFHNANSGKGEAVKTGIKASRGDYLLIQDADLEYNPDEITKLLSPLLKRQKDDGRAVYGSRFLSGNAVISKAYLWGNALLTRLTNLIYRVRLTDMETGYKLMPAKAVKKMSLKASHFDFEPEITAKLLRQGIKITEVPINYHGRSRLAGKKLTVADAYEAIKAIFYYRFFD